MQMLFQSLSGRKKKWVIGLSMIIVLLIGFRLYLPTLVLHIVNNKLEKIDGYKGHVGDIDIFLLAGSYSIIDISLDKEENKIPIPFFKADKIDLSVEWRALFDGAIVGEIEVYRPALNFVSGPSKATTQTEVDKDWTEVVDELMPLRINRFEIINGIVSYNDFHSSPKVSVQLDQLHILATNLTNAKDEKEALPSSVAATANVYDGQASVNMKLNPLSKQPAFDLNAELTTMNLTNFNNFMKAYGNFDVEKGTVSIYMEAAAKDNKIWGYTKPLITDLNIATWKEKEGNVVQKVWESLLDFGAWVFTNHSEDQLGSRIQFEGSLDDPSLNVWSLIGTTLKNAFIQALYPSIENSIDLRGEDKEKKSGFFGSLFK